MAATEAEHSAMFHREPSADDIPTVPQDVEPVRTPNVQSTRPRHHHNRNRQTIKHLLDFATAMNDFEIMFPDMERDTIETVLRANKGVVQSTIDQLLQIQRTNEMKEKISELRGYDEDDDGLDLADEPPPAYTPVWEGEEGVSNLPPGEANSPGEDFNTVEEIEQYTEDEQLAMYLQNDEFVRALKRNPEFVRSLEADIAHQRAERGLPPTPSLSLSATASKEPSVAVQVDDSLAEDTPQGAEAPEGATGGDDLAFRQKLKHMGKSTKKKFGRMANKFSKMRSRGFSFGRKNSTSTFSRLEEEERENQLRMEVVNQAAENEDGEENYGPVENNEDIHDKTEFSEDIEDENEYNDYLRRCGEIESDDEVEIENEERSYRRQISAPPGTPQMETTSHEVDSNTRSIVVDSDDNEDNELLKDTEISNDYELSKDNKVCSTTE